MKTAVITVEVTTHILANSSERDTHADKFAHTSDGAIIFSQSWWYAAITRALQSSGLRNLKPADLNMDLCVRARTELFERRYGPEGRHFRVHEAIIPGTKVMFSALVADHITESTLRTLFDRIGRFIGISPYGHALGFGKFLLLDVKVQASDAKETNDGSSTSDRQAGGEIQPGPRPQSV